MALSRRVSDVFAYELLADVAETGSISRAARHHQLSQAAVSARMRTLEQRLRVRLLHRSATGAALTTEGAAILAHARPMLDAAAALDAQIGAIVGESAVVRIAASSTIAEHLLPARLARLRRQHPHARIELRSVNSAAVLAALRAGEVDIGFIEDERPPADTAYRVIGHDELMVLVARDHPWTTRDTITAAELAAAPLITREPGSGARTVIEHRLRAHRTTARSGRAPAELTSNTAIKNAVAQGLGVAILSSLVAATDLASGQLRRVTVDGIDLRRELHAVWNPTNAPPPSARGLIQGTNP